MATGNQVLGGSFLLPDRLPADIFTPEDFTEEQLMLAKTTADFVENELMPRMDELEERKIELTRELLLLCGELGLLCIEIPEEYGGLDLDKTTALLVAEKLAKTGSFATSFGGHTGIGTLPIVFFGTESQKQRYLPKEATGELIGAYALTEPWSGTDAMAMRATAILSEDGRHYVLNGTKQFITNAGFADLFIVFAKIDGSDITTFIVETQSPGLSTGPEEKKMGIHGSSTRQLILENVKVPIDNLLGERGRGHVIAFNTLNIGRLKLGVGAIGAAKDVLRDSVKYGLERRQFNTPLVGFGLIREKIANMALLIFAAESMSYRTSGLIDARLKLVDKQAPDAARLNAAAIEEYQIECSIIKVFGSEVLDYAADEGVQILGGYGYLREYPMERYYRDSRINRLYEGTNEINRLIIPGTLLKWAMKGRVPLMPAVKLVFQEISEREADAEDRETDFLPSERRLISGAKKMCLLFAGLAAQKYGDALSREQMVLGPIADIAIQAYAMESAYARAEKLHRRDHKRSALAAKLAKTYICDNIGKVELLGRRLAAALSEGDAVDLYLRSVSRFTRHAPPDVVSLKDEIAEEVVHAEGYPFAY